MLVEEYYESPSFDQDPNPSVPFSIALIAVECPTESEYDLDQERGENLVEQEESFS